jgi:hypothetical protein
VACAARGVWRPEAGHGPSTLQYSSGLASRGTPFVISGARIVKDFDRIVNPLRPPSS